MENPININMAQLTQFLAILLTGLLAGLFYAFDCSIVKGLGNLQNKPYLESFQSINRVILNPYFFASFMGSLVVLSVACWFNYGNTGNAAFYLLLSATIAYVLGVFGVTIFCNVPLNEQLAKFSISSATEIELSAMRKVFEAPWNKYHTIRTIASVVAFGLAILSAFKGK